MAKYEDSREPDGCNPLIAALQWHWTREMIGSAMTWWPNDCDDKMRKKGPEEREDAVRALAHCFETIPDYLDLVKEILAMIRFGLRGRDRRVHAFTAEIVEMTYSLFSSGRLAPPPEATGKTILIWGPPGTGKTTFLCRFGVLLPQILDHITFEGRPWPCRQIIYIRVVAQRNWTDRALAMAILEEFDRVAGSNYMAEAERRGRKGSGTLHSFLLTFNLAAHNHGLGILFLDEVQLLADNQTILNFILNFNTLVGVPLVMAGTPSSQKLMKTDPRFMRRADGSADSEFKRFLFPAMSASEYNAMISDPNGERDPWTLFAEALWPNQYTEKYVPLTYEISFTLNYYSCGLIDYAIKLFIAAQLMRIGSKSDLLDITAITEAYFACFKTSMGYLEALREGRMLDLRQYEDFKGVDLQKIAVEAARARGEARNRSADTRLEEARRQHQAKKDAATPKTKPKASPVDRADLPEASPDEYNT